MASLEDYQMKQSLEIKQIADTLLKGFWDTKDFQAKTEFSKEQARNITIVRALNRIIKKEYGANLYLNTIIKDLEKSLVSVDRKGRTEVIDLFKSLLTQAKEEKQKSGWRETLGI